jgi:vacuolar-type H+-ATPase subunit E/Vma4
MPYETLKGELEEVSQQEIREMMEKAKRAAEGIKRDAQQRAEVTRAAYLEIASKSAREKRVQLLYDAKAETKARVAAEKYAIFERAFQGAQEQLAGLRETSRYKSSLTMRLKEALQEIDEEEVILHIDKRDEPIFSDILQEMPLNCTTTADLNCCGGLTLTTGDERVVVYNTLESRLTRAKEVLKLEIFSTLFGD